VTEQCANPQLRVEAQVFLIVNDAKATDFRSFDYISNSINALHQPKALPTRTGEPVVFRGSTTGPEYTEEKCSPLQVTWSVRPACAKVSAASLNAWCAHNVFGEDHAHGVRQLVTSAESLAPIRSEPPTCLRRKQKRAE
jgi:Delta carbonic anhydrase